MKPLAIDLYCGLGGWTEGLLAAGFDVVGFDIERHAYGDDRYPAQLVVQDVTTLRGSQFADADLIVASPPCQAYSYMAMPWARAKARAAAIRADQTGAKLAELNRLFEACFRIQREAIIWSGRDIPLVVENVRGAEPWVGRARWAYGSYLLWGDVPALMPPISTRKNDSLGGGSWFPIDNTVSRIGAGAHARDGRKVPGFRFDGHGGSFQTASVQRHGRADRAQASAKIAKIPFELAVHVGRTFHPRTLAA